MLMFTIDGAPVTKKNSQRIFRRGRRRFVMPSAASETWTERALAQLRRQLSTTPGMDCPVTVKAIVYRARRTGDLDNFLHAVGDALQKAGVLKNDSQIESWDGSRKVLDRARPRIEIVVRAFDADAAG